MILLFVKCSLVKKLDPMKNALYLFSIILFVSCSLNNKDDEHIMPKSTHYQYNISPILADQSGKLFFVTKNTVNGNEIESEILKSDLLLLKLNENGEKIFEEKFEYSSQVFTDKTGNIYVINFFNSEKKTEILVFNPSYKKIRQIDISEVIGGKGSEYAIRNLIPSDPDNFYFVAQNLDSEFMAVRYVNGEFSKISKKMTGGKYDYKFIYDLVQLEKNKVLIVFGTSDIGTFFNIAELDFDRNLWLDKAKIAVPYLHDISFSKMDNNWAVFPSGHSYNLKYWVFNPISNEISTHFIEPDILSKMVSASFFKQNENVFVTMVFDNLQMEVLEVRPNYSVKQFYKNSNISYVPNFLLGSSKSIPYWIEFKALNKNEGEFNINLKQENGSIISKKIYQGQQISFACGVGL